MLVLLAALNLFAANEPTPGWTGTPARSAPASLTQRPQLAPPGPAFVIVAGGVNMLLLVPALFTGYGALLWFAGCAYLPYVIAEVMEVAADRRFMWIAAVGTLAGFVLGGGAGLVSGLQIGGSTSSTFLSLPRWLALGLLGGWVGGSFGAPIAMMLFPPRADGAAPLGPTRPIDPLDKGRGDPFAAQFPVVPVLATRW